MNGVSVGSGRAFAFNVKFMNEWDAANQELTFARGATIQGDVKITVDVAFAETTALPFQPVLGTLNQIQGITAGIISGIEAETNRIIAARFT